MNWLIILAILCYVRGRLMWEICTMVFDEIKWWYQPAKQYKDDLWE